MYFLDLFAGIGGFALGAKWAGIHFDAHYFSEVDNYAIKVYSKRFPDAIGLGDIRNIRGADLPAGDWIIAGGFPCQDISVAGKGAGLAGERSGLWFEYARLIGELRPSYAIMENVGALTFRGLDAVLGSLAEIGYDAEWQDIRASDVGAPHRRERIWIVAYPMRDGRNTRRPKCARQFRGTTSFGASDVADTNRNQHESDSHAFGRSETERLHKANVANSDEKRLQGAKYDPVAYGQRAQSFNQSSAMAHSDGTRLEEHGAFDAMLSFGSSEASASEKSIEADVPNADNEGLGKRNGGKSRGPLTATFLGDWWTTEPNVGRVAHGIPSRVDRLKCLGNSIVPQIAELIFRAIGVDTARRE